MTMMKNILTTTTSHGSSSIGMPAGRRNQQPPTYVSTQQSRSNPAVATKDTPFGIAILELSPNNGFPLKNLQT